MSKLRISGIIEESIVDGPGIRFVIFSQGCYHNCPGCHNPATHDLNGGYEITVDDIMDKIKKNPLLSGVTFSGGEPFLQSKAFSELAKKIHDLGLNVITYTGYTMEQFFNWDDESYQGKRPEDNHWKDLLENTDILIDGPFILEKKSLLIKFRGSSNQRIIDPKKSLSLKKVVEIQI